MDEAVNPGVFQTKLTDSCEKNGIPGVTYNLEPKTAKRFFNTLCGVGRNQLQDTQQAHRGMSHLMNTTHQPSKLSKYCRDTMGRSRLSEESAYVHDLTAAERKGKTGRLQTTRQNVLTSQPQPLTGQLSQMNANQDQDLQAGCSEGRIELPPGEQRRKPASTHEATTNMTPLHSEAHKDTEAEDLYNTSYDTDMYFIDNYSPDSEYQIFEDELCEVSGLSTPYLWRDQQEPIPPSLKLF